MRISCVPSLDQLAAAVDFALQLTKASTDEIAACSRLERLQFQRNNIWEDKWSPSNMVARVLPPLAALTCLVFKHCSSTTDWYSYKRQNRLLHICQAR